MLVLVHFILTRVLATLTQDAKKKGQGSVQSLIMEINVYLLLFDFDQDNKPPIQRHTCCSYLAKWTLG